MRYLKWNFFSLIWGLLCVACATLPPPPPPPSSAVPRSTVTQLPMAPAGQGADPSSRSAETSIAQAMSTPLRPAETQPEPSALAPTSLGSVPAREEVPAEDRKASNPLASMSPGTVEADLDKYVVQPGDILSLIARCFRIKLDDLAQANSIVDKDKIREGAILVLPRSHVSPPPPRCSRGFRAASTSASSLSPSSNTQIELRPTVPPPPSPRPQLPAPRSTPTAPALDPPPLRLPRIEAKPPCLTQWNAERKSDKGRVALFVGGEMVALYDKYLRDAALMGRKVELGSLTILFPSGATLKSKRVEVTRNEWFRNVTPGKKWRQELSGLRADAISNPAELAKAQGADLVCE